MSLYECDTIVRIASIERERAVRRAERLAPMELRAERTGPFARLLARVDRRAARRAEERRRAAASARRRHAFEGW